MIAAIRKDGYSVLSIVAHWITAILIVALFLTHEGNRGDAVYAFHVGGGAIAGLFLMWRVWHRVRRGMTENLNQPIVINLTAHIVLWGFLAAIVIVTISGYLLVWSAGQPLEIYGLVSIPSPMDRSRAFNVVMEEVHEVSGQLFPFLLLLHVAGAAKHAIFDRDGVLSRMLKPIKDGR